MFAVKEIFKSVQGEGSRVGFPTIFVRFAGCNLWSGLEHLREKGIGHCALWCDTDFVKGTKMSLDELVEAMEKEVSNGPLKMVVFSGGEPTLQLKTDEGYELVQRLFSVGWWVCVETNGTHGFEECPILEVILNHPKGHITMSPKPLKADLSSVEHLKLRKGTDLKVVVPTPFPIEDFIKDFEYEHYFFQPLDTQDGSKGVTSVDHAIQLCEKYGWRLSCQTHKFLNLP